jgi:hypothetical protein
MLLSRHTRRREFISLIGGAAAVWPLAARAQQPGERMPRVGVLRVLAERDAQAFAVAVRAGLRAMRLWRRYFREARWQRCARYGRVAVICFVHEIATSGSGGTTMGNSAG